jgi:glucose-6-phosphate 1-dehydrogenase
VIGRLALFGATGDLAGRYLLPALAALGNTGKLPDGFVVVGAGRQNWSDEAFRGHAAARLDEHAASVPPEAREALVHSLRYMRFDLDDPGTVASVIGSGADPVAAYLALPPGVFATAVAALGEAGLPEGSRMVLEKPFGEDLESAVALNRQLERLFGAASEQAVFRVDHVLGLATVQNMLGLRLANRMLETAWNSAHIEQIDLLWEETLALEGRAAYYDDAGALKDVMQNHLLQVLSLIAMESPASLGETDQRDSKAEVPRALRLPGDARTCTRRARYTAGRLADGRRVPAYVDEDGVDAGRGTETFAEIALELDTERWAGTRFVLRAGKAMRRRRKEAVVRFRPVRSNPVGAGSELRIGLDGPEDLALRLIGAEAGNPPRPVPLMLTGDPPASDLPAYSRVLLDVLGGGSALSVRGDEAEATWSVVMPVLDAWAGGHVALQEYPAGSDGPADGH